MRDLLILALATWRLSSLLAHEDGPYRIFDRFRIWAGVEYGQFENPIAHKNEFAYGLTCIFCNSVWVGLFWTVAYLVSKDAVWLALPFALSAAATLFMDTRKE